MCVMLVSKFVCELCANVEAMFEHSHYLRVYHHHGLSTSLHLVFCLVHTVYSMGIRSLLVTALYLAIRLIDIDM